MSATTTTLNSTSLPLETMSLQDMQVPIAMAIGLIGFLIALGVLLQSKNKQEGMTKVAFEAPSTPKSEAPSTPAKEEEESEEEEVVKTPSDQKTGSIQTPAGRRSARLAKRRKED